MKSAPLGLAGGRGWSLATEPLPVDGDRMTALIHHERQWCKKINFFAKKPLPRSLFQHVQTLCMPSFIDFHTRMHTQHQDQAMWRRLLAVKTLPIDRCLAWLHVTKIHAIDRNRAETWNTSGKPRAVAWKLTAPCICSLLAHAACSWRIVLDSHHPVMTGHNARRPRAGRERRPWWRTSEASYLTVWTLNDRFFASLVHCMLRRMLSENWRKETEKWKVFFVGW